jgi:hypothetical protein
MSHALATVLHRGRKAASNVMAACLASSRVAPRQKGACKLPGSMNHPGTETGRGTIGA